VPIVIEVPEKFKDLADTFRSLLADVTAQVDAAPRGRSVDYAAVEERFAERTAEIERQAHRVALAVLDVDRPSVFINGIKHTRAGRFPGWYGTMAGPIQVERTVYRIGTGPTVDPIALRVGAVGDGWLPRTARAMAFEVQKGTVREAAASAREHYRLPYSTTAFDRVAHLVGREFIKRHQDVEDALIQEYVIPEETQSVSVSLDRVAVPMEEPRPKPRGRPRKDAPKRYIQRAFRMAYCATMTLHDGNGKALYTVRHGTMPEGDVEDLLLSIAADVVELLRRRPELGVSLLCDGAPEMWNRLEATFTEELLGKKARRGLDYYHVIEKLAPAVKVIHGDEGPAVLARWKARLLNVSRAGQDILEELKASGMADVAVGKEKPVHAAITYLTNHAERLDFAAARRAGLPIGSGNVEATCKSLFELRFRRPGSKWKTETGETIVRLRALALSDRWSGAIDRTLAPLRHAVRLAA
jgi:hypothetical protein